MKRVTKLLSAAVMLSAGVALAGQASAQSASDLMMKALGTTEGVNPVLVESFEHAAMPLTAEQQELALKCWKDGSCETGHGELTVAYADGFGENVWRRVTAMEYIAQALTYPEVKKIVYTSARGDASKAIADMRAYIAQKVDVIVMFADAGEARRIAGEALARAGAGDIHPRALVKDLPLSRRQMVEIAKALARNPRILILDEATSALTAADVSKVFAVLKRLRSEGLALLYISHRMNEIAELADECTVFRNGRNVASYKAGTKTDEQVVELMIGREYHNVFPPKPAARAESVQPVLECRHLSWTDRLKDITFGVRPGEVIGLGGLDGQGQRELLLACFGVLRGISGQVLIDGRPVKLKSPAQARKAGIGMALIPEDRKTEGLMLPMSVRENLSFAALDKVARAGIVDRSAEDVLIADMVKLLAIRAASVDIPVGALSGGNQQKVVIAKWLMRKPRIILLNDPTRGIDVGTKQEIYQLLRTLADEGAAIIFYSTDYDELIGCCDRVLVMYDGGVRRELRGAEITEHALISSALNIATAEQARVEVRA